MDNQRMFELLVLFCFGFLCTNVFAANPKVTIKRTFPMTTSEKGKKTLVVEKDRDCLMSCIVSNKPSYRKAQWIFQDRLTNTNIPISTDTNTDNTFKYQIDKPAGNEWRLKVRNVQESDQGTYICRVQLTGYQSALDTREIKVIQKPQIIDVLTSSDLEINEGDRTELRCSASGIPTPVISWQLVSGGTLPTGGREYTGSVLLLENASREHRGLYKCVAMNQAGKDERRIKLDIRFQPTLRARTSDLYQAIGHSRQLTCEAFASPLPTNDQIMWYKEGRALQEQDKYTFEAFRGSNYVLMKLTVHQISVNDFGQYRCYGENSEGAGDNFVELRRSGTPIKELFKDQAHHRICGTFCCLLYFHCL